MPKNSFVPINTLRSVKKIEAVEHLDDATSDLRKPVFRFPRTALTGACVLALALPSAWAQKAIENGEPITFAQAHQIAVERSPRAQLLEAQLEAAEGQIEQAQLRPNPTIGAELDNVLGTGELSGVDGAELTMGISQLLERREKRRSRADLARESKELFRWDYEEAVASLRYEVKQTFSQALLAQENVALQKELLELANESEVEVERRASAAKASAIELSQAKLATSRQRYAISTAERHLTEAKTQLAAIWNEPTATDFQLEGTVQIDPDLLPLSEFLNLIDYTPNIARFQSERQVQEAAIRLEQAEAKGDVEVFGGVKYLRGASDEGAFVVGVDIPWLIRNRNQGNIRSARAGLRVVEAQRQLAHRDATAALTVAYREMSSALEEWKALSEILLPAATATVEETKSGYEKGLITLLNVLEARKDLFEIRSEMLDATQRYLSAQIEIEKLTTPSASAGR